MNTNDNFITCPGRTCKSCVKNLPRVWRGRWGRKKLFFLGNRQGFFENFQPFVDFQLGYGQWRRDPDDTLRTAQKKQSTLKGQVHDTIAKLLIWLFALLILGEFNPDH